MTREEFDKEIQEVIENRPEWSRKGQVVFNYIDCKYGVARIAQFNHGKDCFYDDKRIPEFVDCCWELMQEYFVKQV